jgi:hypothetical protein
MTGVQTRFFPDTNIIIGLILQEQRFWSSNVLFSEQIKGNSLPCTILPTIEAEFRRNLDERIDLAGELLGQFMQALNTRKSHEPDPKKALTLGREDVNKVERSFHRVYRNVSEIADLREKARMVVAYDLIEAWIMDYWSLALKENVSVAMDGFADSLKSTISIGRRELEDGYQSLKLRFNHIDCDWQRDSTMEANIGRLVKDPDDVPHVSMAACYARDNSARAIYVTNDNDVLSQSERLQNRFNLVATKPAFAYAYSLT